MEEAGRCVICVDRDADPAQDLISDGVASFLAEICGKSFLALLDKCFVWLACAVQTAGSSSVEGMVWTRKIQILWSDL